MKAYLYGRFSAKRQEKGNSQVRQIELARQWCERQGIVLEEKATYFDEGVSGFHGAHRTRGKLGQFLDACRRGQVERGSILLVESLDRLSREHLFHGQTLIRELLFDHGIGIVTLFTNVEFNAENYETTHWLIDAEFQRAHSESKSKSLRSLDNWQRRRTTLADKPLTAKVPAWVKVVDGKLVEDTPKADIIRRIFALSIQGFGTQSIAKKLNAEQVPPITRAALWHESYVVKILSSRAVIGEFQPQMVKGGKRVAAGPVVQGYFPVVIDEGTWQQNRNAMLARRNDRGKLTKKVSNLFTGLVWENGERMAHRSTNFVGYLQTARKDTPGVKYAPFERTVLWWVREVELCLKKGDDYATAKAVADELDRTIRSWVAKLNADPSLMELGLGDTLSDLKRKHAEAVVRAETAAVPMQSHILNGKRLVEALATAKADELEGMRRSLRLAIRQVVEHIVVKVTGDKYAGKTVVCLVTLKDGQQHIFWYRVKAGRVVDGGQHLKVDDLAKLPQLLETGTIVPDEGFPTDPDPLEEIKATCKRMRAEGKSYKDIMEVTGFNRVTIYRYVTDYARPEQKSA